MEAEQSPELLLHILETRRLASLSKLTVDMLSTPFVVVHHDSVVDFATYILTAQEDIDTSRLNVALGRSLEADLLKLPFDAEKASWATVEDGEKKIVLVSAFFSAFIGIFSTSPLASSSPAIEALAEYLITDSSFSPIDFRSIVGAKGIVNAFQCKLIEAHSRRTPAPVEMEIPSPRPTILDSPRLIVRAGTLFSSDFPTSRFETLFHTLPPEHHVLPLEQALALPNISSSSIIQKTGTLLAHFFAHGAIPSEDGLNQAVSSVETFISRKRLNLFWIYLITTSSTDFEVAGYVLTGRESPNVMAIRNVYVDTKFRQQGVAEKLVLKTCKYNFEERGKKEVTLFCEVENVPANTLYERCRFKWIKHEDVEHEEGTIVVQQGWEGIDSAPW